MKNKAQSILLGFIVTSSLSACVSAPSGIAVKKSYLAQKPTAATAASNETEQAEQAKKVNTTGLVYLPAMEQKALRQSENKQLATRFSATEQVKLTADSLKVKDYLHYVFGELLGVNYVLEDAIAKSDDAITINLQESLSKRDLYALSEQVLTERGIVIREQDKIYYIHQSENANGNNVTYSYGNDVENIPNVSGTIIHFAPFLNGVQTSLAMTISSVTGVDAQPLFEQYSIMFKGKRQEIKRALDFMSMMDQPALKNRQIGFYKPTYVNVSELSSKLSELLKQEGISSSMNGSAEQAVTMVKIDRTNTLVFFTNNIELLRRVEFWIANLDQPADGNEQQYFIFEPEFARAVDLGQSLLNLIGGGNNALTSRTSASSESAQATASTSKNVALSAGSDKLKMVVDERSNAIIFHTTGEEYRSLLPLIKRLDVMPKQVVLEVMIAEVKLSDEFNQGVEFALKNNVAESAGNFLLNGSTATGLSYLLQGTRGKFDIDLFQKNENVNVLSRPTISVRDGVEAHIAVGDEIPTTGEIVTDPVNGSRSSVVYRKTGITLNVTPTVNAQGVILMEIEQEISNNSSGDNAVQGQPSIFTRSIKTEVIAGDGQTIMLGGLISENQNETNTGVPFFSSIPILGKLFDGVKNTKDKTELVVMVTPKIVDSANEWQGVIDSFKQNLNKLSLETSQGH